VSEYDKLDDLQFCPQCKEYVLELCFSGVCNCCDSYNILMTGEFIELPTSEQKEGQ